MTTDKQVAQDAVDATMERWEEAVIRAKVVRDCDAWAFRVAANAAKRLGARRQTPVTYQDAPRASRASLPDLLGHRANRLSDAEREKIRRAIFHSKNCLVGRQFEVLMKLTEANMSLHRAAKELRMDRSGLRRSFRTGMARLSAR